MSEVPETYNELVEMIENNDPGVVAQIIQENYTSNEQLEEMADWMGKRAGDNERKAKNHDESDQFYAFYEGMAVGRERSREEVERKL